MKCNACKFVSNKRKPFILLKEFMHSLVPETKAMYQEHEVYACPQCGTLQIKIPDTSLDELFTKINTLIDNPTSESARAEAREALYRELDSRS